jgi:hypothetical protein
MKAFSLAGLALFGPTAMESCSRRHGDVMWRYI